ncbi:MAG TPA: GGDEF domain-containing protein [Chloroflexota bacterium]|jgi:diguanylate cyclase (GGDEF)-like protein|nr:GGDEF domain-containing protein [Chloroflexota bacterium]
MIAERLRQLSSVALFRGLTDEQLMPLAEVAVPTTYRSGEAIMRQGDPGESVYVITSGKVEVLARSEQDPNAREAVVAWLVSGDAVGELSLLDEQPRSASCIAVEETTCLRLERRDFLTAMQRHWPLSEALLKVLANRLRLADKLLAENARDPLTGLNNRRALAEIYERERVRWQHAARRGGDGEKQPLAVLFADIDNFKSINDTHGHMVGDDVLRSVALTLTAVSRGTDVVARFGGDEFVMLLPEAGRQGAERVAARVRELLEKNAPGPVPFSVSIGTAVMDGKAITLEQLLERADKAMYEDKARLTPGRA